MVAVNPELNLMLRHVIGIFILASAALIVVQLGVMWHKQFGDTGKLRVKLGTTGRLLIAFLGLGVGLLVGATSIGAGSVLLPLLVLLLRVRMRELVSTDVVVGAVMAIVGAAVHSLVQAVSWDLVAALLLGSLPGALIGGRLVGVVSTRLTRGFVAGALVVAGLVLTGILSTTG
jgi:uncharacterized membrane protein YfcA